MDYTATCIKPPSKQNVKKMEQENNSATLLSEVVSFL
jgi:hypothetical protein